MAGRVSGAGLMLWPTLYLLSSEPPDAGLAVWPLYLLGLFAAVLVHELGHALAAWLVGWQVELIHARPFILRLRPLAIRIAGRSLCPKLAGWVLASPRTLADGRDRRRYALFIASGPAASAILAVLLLTVAATLRSSIAVPLVNATGLLSAAVALTTLLPLSPASDGQKLLLLARGGCHEPRPAHAALLWNHGVDTARWTAWAQAALETEGGRGLTSLMAFAEACAGADVPKARAALGTLRARIPTLFDAAEAYLLAALEHDAVAARALLAGSMPTIGGVGFHELAEAAIAARLDNRRTAQRLLSRLRRQARIHLVPPTYHRLVELAGVAPAAAPLERHPALA